MGTTVTGGMVAASGLGIFLVPAIFYIVEELSGAVAHPIRPVFARIKRWAGDGSDGFR